MYKCEICGEEFAKFQQKSNHIRWIHRRSEVDNIEFRNKLSQAATKWQESRYGKWLEEIVVCSNKNCNNETKIKFRDGKKPEKSYCCRSCANSREWSTERYEIHMKRFNDPDDNYAKGFKSQQGKIVNKKIFSSKNERFIVKYFKDNFASDDWKSGGCLNYNDTKLVRDMWSDKLKICFEYDGIWHFKDIHGQLESKQFKDKLLEIWCIENNYRLIRIDEELFENVHQIVDFIYNDTRKIIKHGVRY